MERERSLFLHKIPPLNPDLYKGLQRTFSNPICSIPILILSSYLCLGYLNFFPPNASTILYELW